MKALSMELIVEEIKNHASVDAIYLYGSRAKGVAREDSDWDVGVLFSDYERDALKYATRIDQLQNALELTFNVPDNTISLVDIEHVPLPLKYNILLGDKHYDRLVSRVKRVEGAILSEAEKDYGYF